MHFAMHSCLMEVELPVSLKRALLTILFIALTGLAFASGYSGIVHLYSPQGEYLGAISASEIYTADNPH